MLVPALLLLGYAVIGYDFTLIMAFLVVWLAWQAGRLTALSKKADKQAIQLSAAQEALDALQKRLAQLESTRRSTAEATTAPASEPAKAPAKVTFYQPPTEPELTWSLPAASTPTTPVAPPAPPKPSVKEAPTVAQTPTPPPAPRQPNPVDQAIEAARNWLLGGNTVLRVGLVLLFLGLAFLLRYATEGMVVPLEVRYAGVAAVAMALVGLGWWLRARNPGFALMVQGAGIGTLYLTVFAAMKLHPLLDPTLGFGLLVVIMACSAVLAINQNSLALACAATLGGFAAPILASTGQGSHVALFSYFTLLNVGIFAIAWFKAWRLLNLIGFVGTFGIGFAWGVKSYTPALFWSTEPFLVLFFLMYLAIGLLFARRKLQEAATGPADDSHAALLRWTARQGDYVDGSLLFGTPLVGFGLQYAIVEHLEFGPAFSALVLGLVYMGIARLLVSRVSERATLLVEACLSLGVVFASLAIPLGLDARWTTCAWAIEGAAIFWLGLRQQRLLARGFGLLLQLAAGVVCLDMLNDSYSPWQVNGDFWTPMILALAAFASALCCHRMPDALRSNGQWLGNLLVAVGGFWWAVSMSLAVLRFATPDWELTWLLLAASASVALWTVLALRLRWPGLALLCCMLMPVSALLLLGALDTYYHPFALGGWLAWLLVAGVHLLSLRRLAPLLPAHLLEGAHALGGWVLLGVVAAELRFVLLQLAEQRNAWRWLGWALLPSLYLWAMASQRPWPWPVAAHPRAYRVWVAAPLAALMLAWFWLANTLSDGSADPLPYIALLNPLELGLLLALGGVLLWLQRYLPQLGVNPVQARQAVWLVGGASLFALLTAMVMRSVHHWSGVPWDTEALLGSMTVQASLSITWSLMALALMIGGHLKVRREVWLAGAVLIGVVVVKLFFVELSDRGSMARIVSFIGVGILLLVVGYFAPLPPKPSVIPIGEAPGPTQP